MVLLKIKDFDPDYRETFGGYDIKALNVYSDVNNEKIGSVHDLLVDEQGHFRYFIVDLGSWGFGKKVLLPVGRSQVDSEGKHIYSIEILSNPLIQQQIRLQPRISRVIQPVTLMHPTTTSKIRLSMA